MWKQISKSNHFVSLESKKNKVYIIFILQLFLMIEIFIKIDSSVLSKWKDLN